MENQTIVFPRPCEVVVESRDVPEPAPDELLIQSRLSLISTGTNSPSFPGPFRLNPFGRPTRNIPSSRAIRMWGSCEKSAIEQTAHGSGGASRRARLTRLGRRLRRPKL